MKKLVFMALIAVGLVFGTPTEAFAHTSKAKVTHSSSYTKGFRKQPKKFTPNYYHNYWTGNTKYRQHGK